MFSNLYHEYNSSYIIIFFFLDDEDFEPQDADAQKAQVSKDDKWDGEDEDDELKVNMIIIKIGESSSDNLKLHWWWKSVSFLVKSPT